MSRHSEDLKSCIICNKAGGDHLRCNPDQQYLDKLREAANKRCSFEETKYITTLKRIESISEEQFLASAYHSSCHKDLTHAGQLKRAETRFNESLSIGKVVPIKQGRRSNDEKPSEEEADGSRPKQCTEKQKMKTYIFQCSQAELGALHRVESVSRGETFMEIKQKTSAPKITVALANINEPLDCAAYDIHYHRDCLRNQERKVACLKNNNDTKKNTTGKYISDIEILNAVRYSLSCGSQVTMNDVTQTMEQSWMKIKSNQYPKKLMQENIPSIGFVKQPRANESERVVWKGPVEMDIDCADKDELENVKTLSEAAAILRYEITNTDNWLFQGSLDGFGPP
eukprot:gene19659-21606_t